MYRFIILLFILLSSQVTIAQKSSKAIEVKASGTYIKETFRLYSSPQIKFIQDKNIFGFGPNFLLASASTASDNSPPRFTGFVGNYEYSPLETKGKINFFLFTEVLANRILEKWTSTMWESSTQSYQAYAYKSTELLLQNFLGYGVLWQPSERIAVKQSVGLGLYYSYINNKEFSRNAPEIPDENINGYGDFGLNLGFSLSCQIRL